MAQSILKHGFSAGELSPQLHARTDLEKYALGAELIRNFYVDYRGGVSNRPGTRYVADAASDDNDAVRLIPFVFSNSESYLIELTHLQMRVFLLGTLVATLATPWEVEEIWNVRFTQSADVMTLDHPNHMPHDLRRTGITTFELVEETFGPSIDTPDNLTATASSGGSMRYAYTVTAIDATGQESLQTVPKAVTSAPLDPTNDSPKTVALTWDAVDGAVAYNIYKNGPVPQAQVISSLMGYIGQSAIPRFTDINIAPDFSRTPPIFRDPFSAGQIVAVTVTAGGTGFPIFTPCTIGDGGGYGYVIADNDGAAVGVVILNAGKDTTTTTVTPASGSGATFDVEVDENHYKPSTVSYFQQRRVHGGSNNAPDLLELSQISAYVNFDYSAALLDSDAITVSVASREVNQIKHFVPMSTGLVVMTNGGAFLVTGGQGEGSAVTPTSISALPQAATGAGDLPPILINYNIIFQQAMGSIVRDMAFNFQTQSYYGTDRSMLANHLFHGYTLEDWAFAEEPHKLLWCVRNDGKALTMTYVPDQEVYAWARHDTNGLFKSVTVVPEGHINAVYFVIRRYVDGEWKNYIERLMSEPFDCVLDTWYLDCAVKNEGDPGVGEITISYVSENTVEITGYVFSPNHVQAPDFSAVQGASGGNFSGVTNNDNQMFIDFTYRRILRTAVSSQIDVYDLDSLSVINSATLANNMATPLVGPAGGRIYSCRQSTVQRHDPVTLASDATFSFGGGNWVDQDPASATSATMHDGVKDYGLFKQQSTGPIRLANLTDMNVVTFTLDPSKARIQMIPAPEENGKAIFYVVGGHITTSNSTAIGFSVHKVTIERTAGVDSASSALIGSINPADVPDWFYFTGLSGAAFDHRTGDLIVIATTGPAPAYSGATSYAINRVVASGGNLYKSLQGSNQGNAVTETAWWELLGPDPAGNDTSLFRVDPVTLDVAWRTTAGAGAASGRGALFYQSRLQYGLAAAQVPLGSNNYKTTVVSTEDGAVIDTATDNQLDFQLFAFDDGFGDFVGKGQFAGTLPVVEGSPSSWTRRFMRYKIGGEPVLADSIIANCGVIRLDSYDGGVVTGTVEVPFFGTLANDPTDTVVPIPAGEWFNTDKIDEIQVDHLIGKTVGIVADGNVYAEQVVPESGTVTIDPPARWVVVGLPYQSQLRTMRLEAGETTVQGRRKLISAVTARVSQTRGLKFGTDLAHDMYEYKDLQIEYNVPQVLFTGDQRIALDATWEEGGYVCAQQDYPMPATIVGLVLEATFGDNQR